MTVRRTNDVLYGSDAELTGMYIAPGQLAFAHDTAVLVCGPGMFEDLVVSQTPDIPDTDDLATEDYVDNAVSGLATEGYVDNAVSGLATEGYVDAAVTDMATQQWVLDQIDAAVNPE